VPGQECWFRRSPTDRDYCAFDLSLSLEDEPEVDDEAPGLDIEPLLDPGDPLEDVEPLPEVLLPDVPLLEPLPVMLLPEPEPLAPALLLSPDVLLEPEVVPEPVVELDDGEVELLEDELG